MLITYKPKSIEVIGFDRYDYDFLKKFRRDIIISIPLIHAQEINYVLDANGNLVTGDGFYREYNELNQLIRVRQGNVSTGKVLEEYTWHPVEERILIKDVYYNNTKNYTVYYVSNEYVVIENSTGNYTEEYIYQDNILVAQVDTNGNKIAVHPDHEGSSTTFTNAQGNVIETTFYSAYGEILSGGKTSRFDYEGKEFDSLVKDYDFGFRKYKPDPPIFTQPDTLIQNVYDPQLLNRYSFERNNPLKNTDPDGHEPVPYFGLNPWGVATGLLIVLAIFIYKSSQKTPTGIDEDLAIKYDLNNIPQIENPYAVEEDSYKLPNTAGTYVPLEAIEEQERLGKEICERANIDCGEDSRLKLKIDPTIDQDKYISKLPEEKKEEKSKNTGGPSGSSGGSGPYGCSWWAECIVTYDSLG